MNASANALYERDVIARETIDAGTTAHERLVRVGKLAATEHPAAWVARVDVVGERGGAAANLTRSQTVAVVRALMRAADLTAADVEERNATPSRKRPPDSPWTHMPGVPMGAKRTAP